MLLPWLLSSLALVYALSNAPPAQQLDVRLSEPFLSANADLSALLQEHGDSNFTTNERRWLGDSPAPASNDVWERAKCKGRKFMTQMSYSDYDVGQCLPTTQNTARSPWYFGLHRALSCTHFTY
jgi:hypothetical protein